MNTKPRPLRAGRMALLAGTVIALAPAAALALPPDIAPATGSPLVRVQADATEPTSAEQLRKAIDEIKARLARQRAAQPQEPQPTDLASQMQAASQRIAALTQAMEELRVERDRLREELAASGEKAAQLDQELAELRRTRRDSDAAAAERTAMLERRVGETESARDALAQRVAALEGELQQGRDAIAAADAAVTKANAERDEALVAAAAATDQAKKDAGAVVARVAELEKALAEREASRNAAVDDARQANEAALRAEARAETLESSLAEAQGARAKLADEIKAVRSEADAQARQRADALAAEVAASQERARKLDTEINALRDVASSSVKEVQSLGEQLLATLAENQQLAATITELRASRELLESELAATRAQAALAAPPPAVKPAAAQPIEVLEMADAEPAAGAPADVAALLRQVKAVDAGDGWVMAVPAGLAFRTGSDQLDPASTGSLATFAEIIRTYGNPAVRVVGHTDSGGDADENRRLSQRRAEAVRQYLVDQFALEPRLITTEGYGEDRPVASNQTVAGRRQNRRVEIYLHP
ncbi:MAG: OmpA family protein [Geminicoccaceae bacterium]